VPAEGNGDLQTLICVFVARPRRCLTLSNPVPWPNWMAAYLGYTLRIRTLFRGWPIMVNDTHTRGRLILLLLPPRRQMLCDHYCLSVILSEQDCCKGNQPTWWHYDWAYQSGNNWVTFVGDMNARSLFHGPRHCGIGDLSDLLAFLVQSPASFHDTQRNDWRRQGNESSTFRRHPDPNPDCFVNPGSNPGSHSVEAEVYALWAPSGY